MPTPIRLATSANTELARVAAMPVDHRVGLIGGGDDGEQTERLEVDEHVATVGVDADLGQRHARRAHGSGGFGEELDRHRTRAAASRRRHPSTVAGARPPR